MPTTLPVQIPVLFVIFGVVIAAVLGVAVALRIYRKPVWAIPALVALGFGLAMLTMGPALNPPPPGPSLQDFGGVANFRERYDANRDLYGNTIGVCGVRQGLFVCYTTQARIESHPENKDSYYKIENGNLGIELLEARHLERDANPVIPPIVLKYLAAMSNRGVDTLYWYGKPLTNPKVVDRTTEQYWDKTMLSWPSDSDDPADVRREAVGSITWSIENGGADLTQPDEWTPSRRMLLLASLGTLVITALPLLVPPLRRQKIAYDM